MMKNKTVYRFKYMCGDDKEFCEDSDMTFLGYFVTDESNIYHECDWNFYNYEYYSGGYDKH